MLAGLDLQRQITPCRPPARVARRSDRSDMGCSHTGECPLFPLLNASLRDWRDYYCDSEDGWRGCARYKLSTTGQPVPITLLPNGANAQHLRGVSAVHSSDAAQPRHVPPSRLDPGFPQTPAARFEPAPTPARAFNPASPAQVPHPSGIPSARPTRPTRRRWWTRLTHWMTGPA
jgi:hypothetical protein